MPRRSIRRKISHSATRESFEGTGREICKTDSILESAPGPIPRLAGSALGLDHSLVWWVPTQFTEWKTPILWLKQLPGDATMEAPKEAPEASQLADLSLAVELQKQTQALLFLPRVQAERLTGLGALHAEQQLFGSAAWNNQEHGH
jgi:hypothetical protein